MANVTNVSLEKQDEEDDDADEDDEHFGDGEAAKQRETGSSYRQLQSNYKNLIVREVRNIGLF